MEHSRCMRQLGHIRGLGTATTYRSITAMKTHRWKTCIHSIQHIFNGTRLMWFSYRWRFLVDLNVLGCYVSRDHHQHRHKGVNDEKSVNGKKPVKRVLDFLLLHRQKCAHTQYACVNLRLMICADAGPAPVYLCEGGTEKENKPVDRPASEPIKAESSQGT